MMKNKVLFLFVIIFIQSCKENCGECFSPPDPFLLEIVDKTTSENLFSNNTYNSNEINIINIKDNSNVEYIFIDNVNLIKITTIGWTTQVVNYSINIKDENLFILYVDAERISENCCSYTKYNEIRIENADFEMIPEFGKYKIFID